MCSPDATAALRVGTCAIDTIHTLERVNNITELALQLGGQRNYTLLQGLFFRSKRGLKSTGDLL